MEKILQIVGAEVVQGGVRPDGMDAVLKISCIPFTNEKIKVKKPSLFDLASGGAGVQEILKEAESQQKQITVFYCSLEEWINNFKNRLLTKIVFNIECKQYMEDMV